MSRRPRSSVEAFNTSTMQDDAGIWLTATFSKGMWVTMRPSTRGAHKVPRRLTSSRSHHWKGRIMDLRQGADGSKKVLIQHIYKASQLCLENYNNRFPANYIFLSNFAEWEPLEALSGTFEAYYYDIGKLIYSDCAASELLQRSIFFFDAEYIVPTSQDACGTLRKLSAPTLSDMFWPRPDGTLIALATRRIEMDIFNAMKCTYGAHRANITSFMPVHLFAFLFRDTAIHRTPTMWICKGSIALNSFLPASWDVKVVEHQGDKIKCTVVTDKMVIRYQIGKQQLFIMFPYRRWKLTGGEWQALDSNIEAVEQKNMHVCNDNDVWDVVVNADWSMTNLREYLGLRFAIKEDFSFVIDNLALRKRKEGSYLCKSVPFSRCLSCKESIVN